MSYIEWIRSKVGKHRIFIAFTSVALRDDEGGILLQRRTDFGTWGLPGGILEPGEDLLSCIRRELYEESGLTAGELSLVGVYAGPEYESTYPNGDQVQQYTICFQGNMDGGVMQVDGHESSEQKFFSPQDIPYQELLPWYRDMVKDVLHGGEPAYASPYTREDTIDQIEDVRRFIGRELYIGAGAMAVTRDGDGRILMVHRTDNGQWFFPGGYMFHGENVAYNAVRETLEETGIDVHPERILGVYTRTIPYVCPNGDQVQPVITIFLAQPVGGVLKADGVETSEVAWMPLDEVAQLQVQSSLRPLHDAILAHLDGGYFIEYG
jgi:8-oxo-dGTP diphosphatase